MTCGIPSLWHVSRAAITASGEQQARSDAGASGSIQSRSVTPIADEPARRSATALSTPPLMATAVRSGSGPARKIGPIAFASASTTSRSPGTAAASSRVRPTRRLLQPVGVSVDDAIAVDDQSDAGPLVSTRCVSGDLEHRAQASAKELCPTLPMKSRRVANLD